MLIFCLEDCGWASCIPLLYATVLISAYSGLNVIILASVF